MRNRDFFAGNRGQTRTIVQSSKQRIGEALLQPRSDALANIYRVLRYDPSSLPDRGFYHHSAIVLLIRGPYARAAINNATAVYAK